MELKNINIGDEFLCVKTNLLSRVTNKTANSIELFNKGVANTKGKKDRDGELIKGVDCKNWYTEEWFGRKYKKVDDIIDYKINKLRKWIGECIDKGKWTKLVY